MKSDIEIYKALLRLEREYQTEADYQCRSGDVQEAAFAEAQATGVTEAMIDLFGWWGQQRLRNQAYDLEAAEGEKANV